MDNLETMIKRLLPANPPGLLPSVILDQLLAREPKLAGRYSGVESFRTAVQTALAKMEGTEVERKSARGLKGGKSYEYISRKQDEAGNSQSQGRIRTRRSSTNRHGDAPHAQIPTSTTHPAEESRLRDSITCLQDIYQVAGEHLKGDRHEQPSLLSLSDPTCTSKPVSAPQRTLHLDKHDFSSYGGACNNRSRFLDHEETSQTQHPAVRPSTELPIPSLTPRSVDVYGTRARIYSKDPTPGSVRLTRSSTASMTTGRTDYQADHISHRHHVIVSGVNADRQRSIRLPLVTNRPSTKALDTESRTNLSEERGGFGTTTQDAESDTKMANRDLGRKVEHSQALKALGNEMLEDLAKGRSGFMEMISASNEESRKLGELRFELQGFQKQLLACEHEAAQLERRITWQIERSGENDKSCRTFAAMIERAEAKHLKIEKGLQALVGALGVQ